MTDRSEGRPEIRARSPRDAGDARKTFAIGALVLAFVGIAGFYGYQSLSSSDAGRIGSIAVLPFENRSGTSDTDYLSDGLADSLIYRLTQLPDLKVSPTSSVMRYKGASTDVAQIANDLKVDAVMSGRLMQRGDDLNISVQLTDARTQKLIWAEQYDRKMADLLATQREIAATIAEKLQLKLAGDQTKGITKKYTNSNDAYRSYLEGRFYWNKRTAENLDKAIAQFQQAADADPSFALAYVGLADCYLVLEQYAGRPSSQTLPKARDAALRALEIDDSLAEAHASLGMVNYQLWRPAEAEKEYKRAIELNPNYATAHHWYSLLLTARGRPDEAKAEIERAQQADTLSPIVAINVGGQLLQRGDFDAATVQYQKALDLNPNFPRAISDLGLIDAKRGREQEAIVQLQKAAELTGRANEELGFLGYGYAILGKRSEALAVLKELEARHVRRECPAMYPAAIYGGMNDKDEAFAWLEKDFRTRTGLLPNSATLPIYDTLRDDPRYTDLLRRMGFR
jgi:TolB-like protein/Tfp pilus assembly protein PilF